MLRIWVFDLKSEVISTPLVDGPVNHFSSSQQSARINGKRCGPTPSEDRERPFPKKKQGFQFNKDSGSLKRVLDMISGRVSISHRGRLSPGQQANTMNKLLVVAGVNESRKYRSYIYRVRVWRVWLLICTSIISVI